MPPQSNLRTTIAAALLLLLPLASTFQVFIGAGTVSSDPADANASGCSDIQELACVQGDQCETCAGEKEKPNCRNVGTNQVLGRPGYCDPGSTCPGKESGGPGHCLTNAWCSPHNMTTPTAGTPKHFRCVSVTNLAPNAGFVVFRDYGWQGEDACFIYGNGVWATPGDQLSNSIAIGPLAGQYHPCRKAGQGKDDGEGTPSGGGFPLGGLFGFSGIGGALPPPPVTAEQAQERQDKDKDKQCEAKAPNRPSVGSKGEAASPADTSAIAPDEAASDGTNSEDVGGHLCPRAGGTEALRDKARPRYTSAYKLKSWCYVGLQGQLIFSPDKYGPAGQADIDHIVELDAIIKYFDPNAAGRPQLGLGQWERATKLVQSGGQGSQDIQDAFVAFATYCSAQGNLQGVVHYVHEIKHWMMPATRCVSTTWSSRSKHAAVGLKNYLDFIQPRAIAAASDIGAWLDLYACTTDGFKFPISVYFEQKIREEWEGALANIQAVIDDESIQFGA